MICGTGSFGGRYGEGSRVDLSVFRGGHDFEVLRFHLVKSRHMICNIECIKIIETQNAIASTERNELVTNKCGGVGAGARSVPRPPPLPRACIQRVHVS
jgi:hypothetical protein